jgi:hypothetical protein
LVSKTTKSRSVFHNFQKHLIALLKKIIRIKDVELARYHSGNIARDLWKIFMGMSSFSKKNLHIIFGVS